LVAAPVAQERILGGIHRLGLGEHCRHLLRQTAGGPVGIQSCVGLDFRTIEGDHAQPQQTGLAAQLQHLDEQRLHVGGVPPAKPGDHRVIRHLVADDEPEPGVAPAQLIADGCDGVGS